MNEPDSHTQPAEAIRVAATITTRAERETFNRLAQDFADGLSKDLGTREELEVFMKDMQANILPLLPDILRAELLSITEEVASMQASGTPVTADSDIVTRMITLYSDPIYCEARDQVLADMLNDPNSDQPDADDAYDHAKKRQHPVPGSLET